MDFVITPTPSSRKRKEPSPAADGEVESPKRTRIWSHRLRSRTGDDITAPRFIPDFETDTRHLAAEPTRSADVDPDNAPQHLEKKSVARAKPRLRKTIANIDWNELPFAKTFSSYPSSLWEHDHAETASQHDIGTRKNTPEIANAPEQLGDVSMDLYTETGDIQTGNVEAKCAEVADIEMGDTEMEGMWYVVGDRAAWER
ncbi:hypothetical protein GQ53DRAFT_836060 [Thozetella sp. PMI_491]|nr:hypothetical protein GQ53DRAFT_836060 [Thozetella sp. PMI_491]